ncbi:hypothetical protein ZOSMA_36G00850 [Zostera marina]|uniref:Uncharacterized protein n=1 Tax=Zostera marina TaxID=29655 RepID=A0A0K9P8K0_ZOSMR|nr:hypothetical protein ZOSMA_36G00850 [Zostera marina]
MQSFGQASIFSCCMSKLINSIITTLQTSHSLIIIRIDRKHIATGEKLTREIRSHNTESREYDNTCQHLQPFLLPETST